jgi:hypothetical protein
MWTYILGPFLSLLPKHWRKSFLFDLSINWARAAAISGLAEFVAALISLMYWYSYSVTTWVGRALDLALEGKLGNGVTDHAIGFTALLIWAAHPLTWLLAYLCAEGAARFCGAAFSDSILGTLPLFLLDKIFARILLRRAPGTADQLGVPRDDSSFLGAIGERILIARLPVVSDELFIRRSATEELLEIHACRRKVDWTLPRVVRYQDNYYRLEACSRGKGPRPFRYTLRRLSAGVPGRTVLVYSP